MPLRSPRPRHLALACAAATAALALSLPAAGGAATPHERAPDAQRGQIVSVKSVATLSQRRVATVIRGWEEEDGLRLPTSTVRHGVAAYRLVYRTVGPDGAEPTTASGLVVLPRGGAGTGRVVAWEHGTTVAKRDAPSTGKDSDARLVAYLFAGSGFVAVAPDYLGLGAGPGRHVFNHRPSEITASVDMLRAARSFVGSEAPRLGRPAPGRRLLPGRQGRHRARRRARSRDRSGAPRARGRRHLGHLRHRGRPDPGAVTPRPARRELRPRVHRGLVEPALRALRRPAEVFRSPYGERIERLFDGRHPQRQIFAALPPRPEQLFQPAFLGLAAHPAGPLLHGMQVSDGACRFAPRAPTRLYATRSDEQVSFDNTLHCRRDFADRGVRVPVIDVGEHGHFGSELVAVPRVLDWFRRIR